jgi:hypothetical protein
MKSPNIAPPRLLEDPLSPHALREDLERTAATKPSYDVAAGLIALQATIAGGGVAASGGAGQAAQAAGAKSAGMLGGVKLTLSALGVAAAVATSVALWPSARPAAKPTATAPRTPAAIPPSAALGETAEGARAAEPAVAPEPAITTMAAHESAAATVSGKSRLAKPAATARQTDDPLHREVAQLGEIKASLDSDPARALRLAELGNREFRHGALAQEREALAVLALWNLGRRGEASKRERVFLARYPQSPLRERLQAALHSDAP